LQHKFKLPTAFKIYEQGVIHEGKNNVAGGVS